MPTETMKAAVYRGVNDIRLETIEVPVPGPGEALIQIHACGVCGTDIKKVQYGTVPPPRIFGHEMAGVIVALGSGVKDWQIGERVAVMHHVPCMNCHYCSRKDFAQCPGYLKTGTTAGFIPAGGGFAEYVRAMDWIVRDGMVRIPDNVSFEEASFIEPVNTVLKGVLRANIRPGDTVLVIGQGQIGLLFTQLLKWRGAAVYGSDPVSIRRERSVSMGALEAFSPDEADIARELKNRTEGRGADLVVLAVPVTSVIAQAFNYLRPGGKILLFAQTRLADLAQIDAGQVCMLEKALIGSYSSDISLQEDSARLIFNREIDVRSLATHRFPLEDIGAALDMAMRPRGNSLKVMVTM